MRFAALLLLLTVPLSLASFGQSNPIPLVNQLTPASVAPGGPSFTLTVNGAAFVAGATVQWNGHLRSTTFVSSTQVTATIRSSDIATAGTATIRVKNPTPAGGISNGVFLSVTVSTAAIGFTSHAPASSGTVVAALDFNLDQIQDVAYLTPGANFDGTLEIDKGNGDGTFTKITQSNTISYPYDMVVADFNQDGKPDIAITTQDQSVRVTLNLGQGKFSSLKKFPAGPGFIPTNLIAGDFNRDGKVDLVVFSGGFSFLAGNGDGTFQSPIVSNPVGPDVSAMAAGDFNADGKLDVAVTDTFGNDLQVALGNGDGTFQPPVVYPAGQIPFGVVAADFNGDHKTDLAVVNSIDNSISVYLGNGDGTLQAQVVIPDFGSGPGRLIAADLNGDGKVDLAAPSLSGFVAGTYVLGNGDGTFQAPTAINFGTASSAFAAADFNQDGRIDLLSGGTNGFPGSVLLQTAAAVSQGSLAFPPQLVGTGSAPMSVTLTNVGATALAISGLSITGSFDISFHQQNNCPASLVPGAKCKVTVVFNPKTAALNNATLNIADNAAASPQTVALSGAGSAMKVSPSSLDFGNVQVGMTSPPMTVTLTNLSSFTVQLFNPTVLGDFAQTNNCPGTLNGHQSCTFSVTFTPTATGSRTGTLYISDSDLGSPQTVTLSGNGTP
jgi:hypothetical protein